MVRSRLVLSALLLAVSPFSFAQAAAVYTFERGYPTAQTTQAARDDADYQRAMAAYRFWYPTVSVEGIFNGNRELGIMDGESWGMAAAGPRQVGFTLNSDTPYGSAVIDLSQGPVVIELPPGPYIGLVDDHNQGWVQDLGRGCGQNLGLPGGSPCTRTKTAFEQFSFI